MIGTIRPSKTALDCLGTRKAVAEATCKTCNAVGKCFGTSARVTLSYDAIFLGLFSRNLHSQVIGSRPRFFKCISAGRGSASPDAAYLASAAVFTSATKIADAVVDKEFRLTKWADRKVNALNQKAEANLKIAGLPVSGVKSSLGEYQRIEAAGVKAEFDTISSPIANAYGLLFSNLPSRSGTPQEKQALGNIGKLYGGLTLLLDAVEDRDEDRKAGRFNAWQFASDLPKEESKIKTLIRERFESLIKLTKSECANAADYLSACRESTLEGLFCKPQTSGRLFSHPAIIAGIACCEEDCFGNVSLTPTGMCVAVLACAACVCCCKGK